MTKKKKKAKKVETGLGLWQVLDIITKRRKGELKDIDKSVSVWMINRFLSMSPIYLEFINDVQNLTKVMSTLEYIKVLNKILPRNPKYLSYVKKEAETIKIKKKEEHIFDDMIAVGYSKARAKESIMLLRKVKSS